jgi:hypothetical protein
MPRVAPYACSRILEWFELEALDRKPDLDGDGDQALTVS